MKIKQLIAFSKTKPTNATHDLYTLVTKNNKFKFTTTSQRLTFLTFFISSLSFLLSLFKFSCTKKHHFHNLYRILYTLSFCYVMHYIVSAIGIGGSFLLLVFYCCFQQIMPAVTNEFLIPYNLIKRKPET